MQRSSKSSESIGAIYAEGENMAIATTSQYWTSRVNGENPTSPASTSNNQAWSQDGSGGAADSDYWKVTASQYFYLPSGVLSGNNLTLLVGLYYSDSANIPADNTLLLRVRTATHVVEVKSTGSASSIKLVGATTTTITGLDLTMAEADPSQLMLRLPLDSAGAAILYLNESIDTGLGDVAYYSLTGTSDTTGREIRWGSNDGPTRWATAYAALGAFTPDELAQSDFYQNSIIRTGLFIVQSLKDSKRFHLKTIPDAHIEYGYDISSAMLDRIHPPTIHVLLKSLGSPEFATLSGARVEQEYEVIVYVTTRSINYIEAYRQGLRIAGDIFDELYTSTGTDAQTDSIVQYNAQFDTRLDGDETVCIHILNFTYMKRVTMLTR